jgi:hypothetical protein
MVANHGESESSSGKGRLLSSVVHNIVAEAPVMLELNIVVGRSGQSSQR